MLRGLREKTASPPRTVPVDQAPSIRLARGAAPSLGDFHPAPLSPALSYPGFSLRATTCLAIFHLIGALAAAPPRFPSLPIRSPAPLLPSTRRAPRTQSSFRPDRLLLDFCPRHHAHEMSTPTATAGFPHPLGNISPADTSGPPQQGKLAGSCATWFRFMPHRGRLCLSAGGASSVAGER